MPLTASSACGGSALRVGELEGRPSYPHDMARIRRLSPDARSASSGVHPTEVDCLWQVVHGPGGEAVPSAPWALTHASPSPR